MDLCRTQSKYSKKNVSTGALKLFIEENNASLVELSANKLKESCFTSDHKRINNIEIFLVVLIIQLHLSIAFSLLYISSTFRKTVHLAFASLAHFIFTKFTSIVALLFGATFSFMILTIVILSLRVVSVTGGASLFAILFFGVKITTLPFF
jgi:hypothetical protein